MTDDKKGIMPDPMTGRGDCRDYDDPMCRMPEPIGFPPNYGNGSYDERERKRKEDADRAAAEAAEAKRIGNGTGLDETGQMKKKADGGGLRFNAGKNRMELVPPEWPWALADVTTQGSKKYAARNWERGMDWSNMVGCMHRHITKFLAGERYDGPGFDLERGTTGCHHLAMVAWNALALMSYDLRGVGNNDLPSISMDLIASVNAAGLTAPEKETKE